MFNGHWDQKPPIGTPINQNHPLTEGLVAFWPFWEGSGLPAEIISGNKPISNSCVWTPTLKGWALTGSSTDDVHIGAQTSWLNITGPVTIAALAQPGPVADQYLTYGDGESDFEVYGYGGAYQLLYHNGNTYSSNGSHPFDGDFHTFAVTQPTASQIQMWIDAEGVYNTNSASGFATSYSSQRYLLYGMGGPCVWVGIWSRSLAQAELAAMGTNPWQVFSPKAVAAAIPMTSGPTNFVAAASGGASLGGTAFACATFTAAAEGGAGLGGVAVVSSSPAGIQQPFREALVAKLESIPEVTAVVGEAIYPGAIPETHDLDRDGPALTYTVTSDPRGHCLTGSSGISNARVQLDSWATDLSDADALNAALWNAIDGEPDGWGDGTCVILAVLQEDEQDQHEPPKAGRDEWTYHIVSSYLVMRRTGFPTLT